MLISSFEGAAKEVGGTSEAPGVNPRRLGMGIFSGCGDWVEALPAQRATFGGVGGGLTSFAVPAFTTATAGGFDFGFPLLLAFAAS